MYMDTDKLIEQSNITLNDDEINIYDNISIHNANNRYKLTYKKIYPDANIFNSFDNEEMEPFITNNKPNFTNNKQNYFSDNIDNLNNYLFDNTDVNTNLDVNNVLDVNTNLDINNVLDINNNLDMSKAIDNFRFRIINKNSEYKKLNIILTNIILLNKEIQFKILTENEKSYFYNNSLNLFKLLVNLSDDYIYYLSFIKLNKSYCKNFIYDNENLSFSSYKISKCRFNIKLTNDLVKYLECLRLINIKLNSVYTSSLVLLDKLNTFENKTVNCCIIL